jgi:hypothetical protein
MSKLKLKNLIESIVEENELNEEEFLSDVANYNKFGKSIYRDGSIYDIAKKLSEIARQANIHTVRETEETFDKITVGRNMKELKSYSDQFNKVAKEAHGLQQRMESLYEDMGKVLGRYYEISENDNSGVNEGIMMEAVSFDEKKMLVLIKKDKFLTYVAKKDFKGKVDSVTLEQMYFMYIKGDRDYEKLYKKIK